MASQNASEVFIFQRNFWGASDLKRLEQICVARGNPTFTQDRLFLEQVLPEFPGRTDGGLRWGLKLLRRGAKRSEKSVQTSPPLRLSEPEAAYLAAMLEGEGYISIPHTTRTGRSSRGITLGLLTNTDPVIVAYVHSLIPFSRVKKSKGTNRPVYHVIVQQRMAAREVLRWVLPYMRGGKKEKALAYLADMEIRIG